MPCQEPTVRIKNFSEVALGYDAQMAQIEASRCLKCPKPLCVKGCPVEVPIPEFIKAILDHDLNKAYQLITSSNALPAVCGRVCPQENQCEGKCVLARRGLPVAIGRLERFVADRFLTDEAISDSPTPDPFPIATLITSPDPASTDATATGPATTVNPTITTNPNPTLATAPNPTTTFAPSTGKGNGKSKSKSKYKGKIACIGSGPSSLTVAGDLIRAGFSVTIFEALHRPGGVLIYGIPEFRLPKDDVVDKEILNLKNLGVDFKLNYVGGKTFTIDDLKDQGYMAAFIGVGAGLPIFLGIEGEDLIGVFSANEYLTRANLGRAFDFPHYDTPIYQGKNVTVYGAGNVAMDAARTAIRLGAETVDIVYRRTKAEMPCRHEELEHALEEGVNLRVLSSPVAFSGDEHGRLQSVSIQPMKLGPNDANGRPKPIPDGNTLQTIPTDLAIVSVGTGPNPLLLEATLGLERNARGYIKTDENGETSIKNVFAGGDIVTGSATVI
ncbi:MAG: FAD-dependent oxidoreductase, partial [Deltaproteobacteria bacterium]|nr:FAD-dependent oxidoreductase [Deltaproteobacteria bacterium]